MFQICGWKVRALAWQSGHLAELVRQQRSLTIKQSLSDGRAPRSTSTRLARNPGRNKFQPDHLHHNTLHTKLCGSLNAYVTLQDFTPDLQKIYTDISAISVTFRNSGIEVTLEGFVGQGRCSWCRGWSRHRFLDAIASPCSYPCRSELRNVTDMADISV